VRIGLYRGWYYPLRVCRRGCQVGTAGLATGPAVIIGAGAGSAAEAAINVGVQAATVGIENLDVGQVLIAGAIGGTGGGIAGKVSSARGAARRLALAGADDGPIISGPIKRTESQKPAAYNAEIVPENRLSSLSSSAQATPLDEPLKPGFDQFNFGDLAADENLVGKVDARREQFSQINRGSITSADGL
jgi:hypothetical protein